MRSIKNITLGLATVGVMFLSGCAGDYLDTIPSTSVSETTINTSLDNLYIACLLYTSPSPRDKRQSRMPSSA